MFQVPPRSMTAVTMNDAQFVLIEDPSVPLSDPQTPGSPDVPLAAGEQDQGSQSQQQPQFEQMQMDETQEQRTHRRTSFAIFRPPESLDLLLNQLQAKWVPVRQSSGTAGTKGKGITGGPQVTIEGLVFSVDTDWIIRAGNILLAGGATRGMLLEAEYLPLVNPPQPVVTMDDTAVLLSNMLTSLLPTTLGAKTVVFPITDSLWEDVLFDTDDRPERSWTGSSKTGVDGDDVYITAEEAIPKEKRGDWTGDYRDQRSAFLIIGALKSEGIL